VGQLLLLLLFSFNALGTLIPKSGEIKQANYELGVSRLAALNFLIGVAERIGEADRVKALDHDRNALKKKECFSWVISIGGNAVA
jgi:hypothetical protein